MAQRFYNLVLLPRVRDDIAEYKRLNFHLYMALKKALFKPGAWFKGRSPGGGVRPRRGWSRAVPEPVELYLLYLLLLTPLKVPALCPSQGS